MLSMQTLGSLERLRGVPGKPRSHSPSHSVHFSASGPDMPVDLKALAHQPCMEIQGKKYTNGELLTLWHERTLAESYHTPLWPNRFWDLQPKYAPNYAPSDQEKLSLLNALEAFAKHGLLALASGPGTPPSFRSWEITAKGEEFLAEFKTKPVESESIPGPMPAGAVKAATSPASKASKSDETIAESLNSLLLAMTLKKKSSGYAPERIPALKKLLLEGIRQGLNEHQPAIVMLQSFLMLPLEEADWQNAAQKMLERLVSDKKFPYELIFQNPGALQDEVREDYIGLMETLLNLLKSEDAQLPVRYLQAFVSWPVSGVSAERNKHMQELLGEILKSKVPVNEDTLNLLKLYATMPVSDEVWLNIYQGLSAGAFIPKEDTSTARPTASANAPSISAAGWVRLKAGESMPNAVLAALASDEVKDSTVELKDEQYEYRLVWKNRNDSFGNGYVDLMPLSGMSPHYSYSVECRPRSDKLKLTDENYTYGSWSEVMTFDQKGAGNLVPRGKNISYFDGKQFQLNNSFFASKYGTHTPEKTDKFHLFLETTKYQYAMERVTNYYDETLYYVLKRRTRTSKPKIPPGYTDKYDYGYKEPKDPYGWYGK